MLLVKNLSVSYDKTEAIKNVSLRVERGNVVSLLGSNGAGKTSILNTINGFVHPTRGEIIYKNTSIYGKKTNEIMRRGIVQVSQERDLFPDLSVLENLRLGGILHANKRQILEGLEEIYENFPILKERQSQKASTLSGGEQQMLAIGRAMMSKPELLLLDEPTTGLAPIYVFRISDILKNLRKKGITMLIVEQNAPMAISLSTYYYVLRNGEIVAEGETNSLPKNINDFFGKYYI